MEGLGAPVVSGRSRPETDICGAIEIVGSLLHALFRVVRAESSSKGYSSDQASGFVIYVVRNVAFIPPRQLILSAYGQPLKENRALARSIFTTTLPALA